jgi:hypothetical protein
MKAKEVILLLVLFASCAEPANEKQMRAEQAILDFEAQRKADTALPRPKYYSSLAKKVLKFDVSPEANYFPYLDLKISNAASDETMAIYLVNKIKDAYSAKDDDLVTFYQRQYDSLGYNDSMYESERIMRERARDSCRKVYGDRQYYHVVAHDTLDKIIAEYMLDTTSLQVIYWRFTPYEVYRRRDQKVKQQK